jgi:HopA1 effector protein family
MPPKSRKKVRKRADADASAADGGGGSAVVRRLVRRKSPAMDGTELLPVEIGKPASDPSVADAIGVEVKPVKNKRVALDENAAAAADTERYRKNAEANKEVLDSIYDFFYDAEGQKKGDDTMLSKVYGLMGKGSAGYLKEAITDDDFNTFQSIPGSRINGQKVSAWRKADTAYQARLAKYLKDMIKFDADMDVYRPLMEQYESMSKSARGLPPVGPVEPKAPKAPRGPHSNTESVLKGDYFHVHNNKFNKKQSRKKRSRRIIVNVKTQKAALKLAQNLGTLFQNGAVSPNLSEFKVFLSKTPDEEASVKHDKIVVYYLVDETGDTAADSVGDAIVETIQGSVTEDDVVDKFAPFYSRIGPGVAWAEEPKQFVAALKGSFTRTRSDIISDVIKKNPVIKSKSDFLDLVTAAMAAAKVDPTSPHRHLPE